MAFLDSLNKSLFSVDSYKAAISDKDVNGYAVVKITPSNIRIGKSIIDSSIIGIMQNPVSFGIEATWEDMGGITGMLPKMDFGGIGQFTSSVSDMVGKWGNVAGFADIGSVYSSRLIYKKSGRLNLGIKLKIVDWDGESQPLKAAILISYLCLPDSELGQKTREEVKKWIDDMTKQGEDVANSLIKKIENIDPTGISKKFIDFASEGVKKSKELIQTGSNLLQSTAPNATSNLNDMLASFTMDATLLRSSPSPVDIEIGQYFYKPDMVITGCNFEFSKECTSSGPLYVTIDLEVKSRQILGDVMDVGLSTVKNKSRVSFALSGNENNVVQR